MIDAYAALCEKAVEIGWPIDFQTDLTVDDLKACLALPHSGAFLWVLRENGTSLVVAKHDLDMAKVETLIVRLERFAGPCRFFFWDAGELFDLTDSEEACYVLGDRVRELRDRSQGAA